MRELYKLSLKIIRLCCTEIYTAARWSSAFSGPWPTYLFSAFPKSTVSLIFFNNMPFNRVSWVWVRIFRVVFCFMLNLDINALWMNVRVCTYVHKTRLHTVWERFYVYSNLLRDCIFGRHSHRRKCTTSRVTSKSISCVIVSESWKKTIITSIYSLINHDIMITH